MTENELPGIMVIIDTLLWDDPYDKRGETAVITHADREADDFHVRFDDGSEGLYAAHSLKILKEPAELWKMASGHSPANLSPQAKADIAAIALLLERGDEQGKRQAYRKTAWNDSAEDFTTSSIEYALGMKPSYQIGR